MNKMNMRKSALSYAMYLNAPFPPTAGLGMIVVVCGFFFSLPP